MKKRILPLLCALILLLGAVPSAAALEGESRRAAWAEIKAICDDGMKYQCASVCIPASYGLDIVRPGGGDNLAHLHFFLVGEEAALDDDLQELGSYYNCKGER